MCKTNPISPGRGLVPEAKCAERTQFGPGGRKMRRTNPICPGQTWRARTGVSGQKGPASRALTSNFKPQTSHCPHGKLCKTKPNLEGLGYMGKGHRRVGVARSGSETCKTNPIWGPGAPRLRIEDCGLKGAGRGRVPEAKCAKRSQLGPAGG
jgi:hypothetical protein